MWRNAQANDLFLKSRVSCIETLQHFFSRQQLFRCLLRQKQKGSQQLRGKRGLFQILFLLKKFNSKQDKTDRGCWTSFPRSGFPSFGNQHFHWKGHYFANYCTHFLPCSVFFSGGGGDIYFSNSLFLCCNVSAAPLLPARPVSVTGTHSPLQGAEPRPHSLSQKAD